MRVYVAADMEGCSGIVHTDQTDPRGHDYELARRWMTGEVNAVVSGAFDGGAAEVVVSDAHGANGSRNLLPDLLDTRAELITGRPRPLGQFEGLDGSFDALFLLGFHARQGSRGVLSHTTHGQAVAGVWLDGQPVGEIGLGAYLAGAFGVPVGFVSGDDVAVAEARTLLPGVEGVVVKWALGRYAARCLHPVRTHEALRAGAARASRRLRSLTPLTVPAPVELVVRFKDTAGAEAAARVPGVEAVADDSVRVRCPTMPDACQAYGALVALWPVGWGAWIRG